jgi:uncharacterized alpha-E superfamily protein
VISRVAGSCFWLSRYVERVEVLARMLDVNQAFQLDVDLPEATRWRPLVVVMGEEKPFLDQTPHDRIDDAETVQSYLTWDEENPTSLVSSLRFARENARTIREVLSLEMWESLNDVWVWLGGRAARRLYRVDRHAFYRRLCEQSLLFQGVTQATMLHEDPFEFMQLGTALERAGLAARVLDVKHHSVGPTTEAPESPAETAQWLATLRFCCGVEPFLKRQDLSLSGRAVARFLLFDRAFPRSVVHNLDRARAFLDLVRPPGLSDLRSVLLLAETLDQLVKMNIDTVLAEGLHEVLTWIVDTTGEICAALRDDFFDPAPRPVSEFSPTATQSQTQS